MRKRWIVVAVGVALAAGLGWWLRPPAGPEPEPMPPAPGGDSPARPTAVRRTAPARPSFLPEAELYRRVEQFRDVLELAHRHHVDAEAAGLDRLTEAALTGMLTSLDPHSQFLPARDFEEFKTDTRQEYGGIGVHVEFREGRMIVIAPIAGGPGERAGILRGDQIVRVNGASVDRLTLDDLVERLRGRPGSEVDVTVHRPSRGENLTVRIEREVIAVSSVAPPKRLEGGIGYIAIGNFYERTGEEFRAALAELEREGVQALVIDLRNNPGGLLSAAVAVAGEFFRPGELIVYTLGRSPDSRQNLTNRERPPVRRYPIAVLINSGSASASEIVAGALRDTRRAVVVGERSFGKGLVQSILALRGGEAVRLTTARYYTPGGAVIEERGIAPDVAVATTAEEDAQLRLHRSRADLLDAAEFRSQFGFDPPPDRPLEAAVAVLRSVLLVDAVRAPGVPTGPAAAAPVATLPAASADGVVAWAPEAEAAGGAPPPRRVGT